MYNKMVHTVTFVLLIAGGLNWLSLGAFNIDLVHMLLGGISEMLVRVVYILVGLSAVYEIIIHKTVCTACNASASTPSVT